MDRDAENDGNQAKPASTEEVKKPLSPKNDEEAEVNEKEANGAKTEVTYDAFVKDLKQEEPKKETNEALNASNWDNSITADDKPSAFKKKPATEVPTIA